MLYRWDEFIEEGDELYMYMFNNFQLMFDDKIIKHFDIRDNYYNNINYGKQIYDEYSDDIQKVLVDWIQIEFKENRLFDKTQWKPFRDYNLIDMYYGYKYLFQYKHYYFQLTMETYCEIEGCLYCKDKDDINPHFCLELYGWKDDKYDKLQPWNKILLTTNNIIPEKYWLVQ